MNKLIYSIILNELKIQNNSLKDPIFIICVYLSLLIIFPLSLGENSNLLKDFSPAIIWICALITFISAIEKFFSSDAFEGVLEHYVLSTIPLSLIIVIKVFCYWISVGLPLIILFPIISLFLNLPFNLVGIICFSLTIGTLSFSFIGVMGSALVLGAKKSNLIVILLVLPLTIPVLIFGISTTTFSLEGISPLTSIYLQCMSLSFLIAIVPLITSKAIKIYVE